MNNAELQKLLEKVSNHKISTKEALDKIKPVDSDLPYANLDLERANRTGYPETIYGAGKTAEEIVGIFKELLKREKIILCTRVNHEKADYVLKQLPDLKYDSTSEMLIGGEIPEPTGNSRIAVVTAGTSDLPIAGEASYTARAFGNKVDQISDVGVAGIHRLFDKLPIIKKAKVVVVIAGMDGALPSVIAGLVSAPVIAVPTSVGYGASFNGVAALLTMLNSCAEGISVVNIDNGFGAGYLASMINKL